VAMEFEQQGWTKFTPHYLVWVCPDSYHQSAECVSQCIRQGRYCTPDPDGDIQKGYSGKDIVQARACCVCCVCALSGGAAGRHAQLFACDDRAAAWLAKHPLRCT